MTDEHVDDPDPRGPDYTDPPKFGDQTLRSANTPCPVCGEVHKLGEEDV